MARVTVEDCRKQVDSRFSLVHLAVRRVLQLRSNAPVLISGSKNKEIVTALREIAMGRVTLDNIRELEEQRSLPDKDTRAQDAVAQREVQEILQAATRYDASLEYEGQESPFEESEEAELD
jgi:DNA-directed RNA polymerase subunit omega